MNLNAKIIKKFDQTRSLEKNSSLLMVAYYPLIRKFHFTSIGGNYSGNVEIIE